MNCIFTILTPKFIMTHHPIPCSMQSLFPFLQRLHKSTSETFVATLNHVSFESFRRSSPSPPPKHPLNMKSTNPIVQYFPAIFCTPGAIPDWKVEDSWLFLFNWKLLGRPFSSPQYWQGEKLIKVLHFQIYWKCLRALSFSFYKKA